MILVLAGTADGREIAAALSALGVPVTVSVVSGYGRELAESAGLTVHAGPLDEAGFAGLFRRDGIRVVVDATHPYAGEVSVTAQAACARAGVGYLRYERPAASLPAYDRLHVAESAPEAAKMAAGLGEVIFLTTGSRTLAAFAAEPLLRGRRLIARVLPEPEVLAECRRLGFSPGDIVAMQGPFSRELNEALFREYAADVVVSKNSGRQGGADAKFAAAVSLGLHLVVIDRPEIQYGLMVRDVDAVIEYIKEVLK